MDIFAAVMGKSISTGPSLQEYVHSAKRIHKKPDEGGLIPSLFITQMNLLRMLQEHRQNLALLTG